MKKLLMFIAVVASACAVNAATIQWGAGICEADGVTAVSANQVAYLIWSDTAFSGLASSLDTGAGTTDNGGSVVSTHAVTSTEAGTDYGFKASFSRADADGGVNGYYQILLANPAGDKFAVIDAGQISGISDSTGSGTLMVNVNWDDPSGKFLGDSGYVGTVSGGGGIPEPTSGLLLLIGGSLLALRRKQK